MVLPGTELCSGSTFGSSTFMDMHYVHLYMMMYTDTNMRIYTGMYSSMCTLMYAACMCALNARMYCMHVMYVCMYVIMYGM